MCGFLNKQPVNVDEVSTLFKTDFNKLKTVNFD